MRSIILFLTILTMILCQSIFAKTRYSHRLCHLSNYKCIKIKRGQTWSRLWPNPQERRIVMRVNRMNARLRPGITIAVPVNLRMISHMDISPMPDRINTNQKTIVINMSKQAFGAYDRDGYLLHWGPMSGGKGYCPDLGKPCNTPRGTYRTYRKGTRLCESKKFPIPDGGAPMPFCMYFKGGYAMHQGYLPGYHASHGCVRMFYEDAEWLNKEFLNSNRVGTKVIIRN